MSIGSFIIALKNYVSRARLLNFGHAEVRRRFGKIAKTPCTNFT